MANTKQKQPTLSTLKSASAKKFTRKSVSFIIDDKTYSILVDEHISPIKLDMLVEEMFLKSAEIKTKGIELNISYYLNFLAIKYMTDFTLANNSTVLEEQIQILYYLLELNCFDNIIKNINQEELNELFPQAIERYTQKMISDEIIKQSEVDPSMAFRMLGMKGDLVDKMSQIAKEIKDTEIDLSLETDEVKERDNYES